MALRCNHPLAILSANVKKHISSGGCGRTPMAVMPARLRQQPNALQQRGLHRVSIAKDLSVSSICCGAMNFGDRNTNEEATDIVLSCMDAGVNFFDTANVYNERKGEAILGAALCATGRRADTVIATKLQSPHFSPDGWLSLEQHGGFVRQQCEESLQRLQTDYIDIYQLNWPQVSPQDDINRPYSMTEEMDVTLSALNDLVIEGKVRYLGWTTVAPWQAILASQRLIELGARARFVSLQAPYHLLDRRLEREVIPMCRHQGLSVFAWGPMAGGLLSGKYTQDNIPSDDEMRWGMTKQHFSKEAFRVVDVVTAIAQKHNSSMSQVATAWVMQRAGIDITIVGPRTSEQLVSSIAATNIELDVNDLRQLDQVAEPGMHIVPYLISDCGPGLFYW